MTCRERVNDVDTLDLSPLDIRGRFNEVGVRGSVIQVEIEGDKNDVLADGDVGSVQVDGEENTVASQPWAGASCTRSARR